MAGQERTLTVRIIGNAKSGQKALDGMAKSSEGFGRKVAKVVGVIGGLELARRAGGAILGLGISYDKALNVMQAASQATEKQMEAVRKKAKALGNDLTIPATSAVDAASAMTELVKGGFDVENSMDAAAGTLRLAAAAQIEGAEAATIQANALNQFGLAGKDASHMADVLANVANAATGEITDVANALSYVGPVAASFGISVDQAATALGVLAKNGIISQKAGTGLRGILASLANPSRKAASALKALNIEAFNQKGEFVGLRKITGQLAKAKAKMTEQEFNAAAAAAFGREPLAAINALAKEGVGSWDDMAEAVGREGGAAEAAKAKNKGLGGALDAMKGQLETIAISIYERVSPALDSLVRGASTALEDLQGIDFGKAFDSLNNLDGAALGKKLSKVMGDALSTGGDLAGKVFTWIGETLGKVDWVALGIEAGKAVVPLLLGLALGILNFDLGKLLSSLAANWQAVLWGVIAIVFMPLKWATKIGQMLAKIPFVGKLLAWLFNAIRGAGRKVFGWIKKIIWDNGIMKAWSEVMRGGGVGFITKFNELMVRLVIAITVWAMKLGKKFSSGISKMIYGAAKWLLSHGPKQIMSGIQKIRSKVIGFFSGAGRWLYNAGKKIVTGLIDGIKGMAGAAGDAISGVVSKIKGFLPFSPAKEGPLSGKGNPYNSGRSIGKLLSDGIGSRVGMVAKAASGLSGAATTSGSASFGASARAMSPVGGTALAGMGGAPIYVNVTVEGNIRSEDDFVKSVVPKIRDGLNKIGNRNAGRTGLR